MNEIITSFTPYFTEKKQGQLLLDNILKITDKHKSLFVLFQSIYNILKPHLIEEVDFFELFEKVGPKIQMITDDKQCSSLVYKFSKQSDGLSTPVRCKRKCEPSSIFCAVHLRNIGYCEHCMKDQGKVIYHNYNWEHFGTIFDKDLQFHHGIGPLRHIQNKMPYAKYVFEKKLIPKEPEIEKPGPPKKIIQPPTPKIMAKPKLFQNINLDLKITQIPKTELEFGWCLMMFYILSKAKFRFNNSVKMEKIFLYDDDKTYYTHSKFIYKLVGNQYVSYGILKDSDSVIILDDIMEYVHSLDKKFDIDVDNFVNNVIGTK